MFPSCERVWDPEVDGIHVRGKGRQKNSRKDMKESITIGLNEEDTRGKKKWMDKNKTRKYLWSWVGPSNPPPSMDKKETIII